MLPNKRLHRRIYPALLLASAVLLPAAAAGADEEADARAYRNCVILAGENPAAAFEQASTWVSRGGGHPAEHCAAVALIQLGHFQEAGRRLEELAQTMTTKELNLRIEALAQAAQAWLLAGNHERAFAAQTTALKLAPDNLELLIDRSIVLASAKNYRAALLDLDRAYELAPQRPDVLVYRATVHRFLNSDSDALRDIQAAIQLDPNMPEAYLERGILMRLRGDRNGARRDWVKVLDLGSGTPAADAARVNLELLDVDPNISNATEKTVPRKLDAPLDPPTPLITSAPSNDPAPSAVEPEFPQLPVLGAPMRADPD